jgi:hypothetical protein
MPRCARGHADRLSYGDWQSKRKPFASDRLAQIRRGRVTARRGLVEPTAARAPEQEHSGLLVAGDLLDMSEEHVLVVRAVLAASRIVHDRTLVMLRPRERPTHGSAAFRVIMTVS